MSSGNSHPNPGEKNIANAAYAHYFLMYLGYNISYNRSLVLVGIAFSYTFWCLLLLQWCTYIPDCYMVSFLIELLTV
jgi:hypothetical protein